VEWLDDNAPEHLTTVGEAEYREAAEELGLDFEQARDDAQDGICEDDMNKIWERAEVDLTVIGHTTLKNGTHIASYDWTVNEL
jgi:hypothetical protein